MFKYDNLDRTYPFLLRARSITTNFGFVFRAGAVQLPTPPNSQELVSDQQCVPQSVDAPPACSKEAIRSVSGSISPAHEQNQSTVKLHNSAKLAPHTVDNDDEFVPKRRKIRHRVDQGTSPAKKPVMVAEATRGIEDSPVNIPPVARETNKTEELIAITNTSSTSNSKKPGSRKPVAKTRQPRGKTVKSLPATNIDLPLNDGQDEMPPAIPTKKKAIEPVPACQSNTSKQLPPKTRKRSTKIAQSESVPSKVQTHLLESMGQNSEAVAIEDKTADHTPPKVVTNPRKSRKGIAAKDKGPECYADMASAKSLEKDAEAAETKQRTRRVRVLAEKTLDDPQLVSQPAPKRTIKRRVLSPASQAHNTVAKGIVPPAGLPLNGVAEERGSSHISDARVGQSLPQMKHNTRKPPNRELPQRCAESTDVVRSKSEPNPSITDGLESHVGTVPTGKKRKKAALDNVDLVGAAPNSKSCKPTRTKNPPSTAADAHVGTDLDSALFATSGAPLAVKKARTTQKRNLYADPDIDLDDMLAGIAAMAGRA